MPWTSNGSDANGNLSDFAAGLLKFQKAHPELVDPASTTGMNQEINGNPSHSIFENIYPNPSGIGGFKVVLTDWRDVTLRLTDNRGIIVFNKKAGRSETNISSTNLPKGTYIISAIKGSQVESRKLLLN